jgi:hypothetical protein
MTTADHKKMGEKGQLSDLLDNKVHQRTVLGICLVLLLVLEVVIYYSAASQAGRITRLVVSDQGGEKVYETLGNTMSTYQQIVFEETHGPLENYDIRVESEFRPFPTRVWLASAVGVPIGLILLMLFLVRVFLTLVHGDSDGSSKAGREEEVKQRFGLSFSLFRGISVVQVGLLFLIGAFLLWLVPEFLLSIIKHSIEAAREFKWFFLGFGVFLALLLAWFIYLRFRLSKQMMDNELKLEKYRLEYQSLAETKALPLPGHTDGASSNESSAAK